MDFHIYFLFISSLSVLQIRKSTFDLSQKMSLRNKKRVDIWKFVYYSSLRKHFDVIYFAHNYCSFCVVEFYKILFTKKGRLAKKKKEVYIRRFVYNSSFRKQFDVIYFAQTYCSFCVVEFYKILFTKKEKEKIIYIRRFVYNSSFRKRFDVIYFAHTYCSFCVFEFYKILFSNFDLCFVSFGEKDHWLCWSKLERSNLNLNRVMKIRVK